jgi:hypothetical protein
LFSKNSSPKDLLSKILAIKEDDDKAFNVSVAHAEEGTLLLFVPLLK